MYGESLDNLLKESITPIYGIPEKIPFSEKPDRKIRILLAFDGSPLSARAMQCFTQLADPDLYELTLLNASDNREEGEFILTQAEKYLKMATENYVLYKKWRKCGGCPNCRRK